MDKYKVEKHFYECDIFDINTDSRITHDDFYNYLKNNKV